MSIGSHAPLAGWQRASVLAAAQFLRDVVSRAPDDVKVQAVYRGLLEVLEPARRTVRQQLELSQGARPSVSRVERRAGRERRQPNPRRLKLAPRVSHERRVAERRSCRDRRNRS